MPVPTAYTEEALVTSMIRTLGATATALGWTASNAQYEEAVTDALLLYGVTSIAAATDIPKLRALARLAVWRRVVENVAGNYAFSADGASYSREQVQTMALRALAQAERDAAALGVDPAWQVRVDRAQRVHDPYVYVESEHRTLP